MKKSILAIAVAATMAASTAAVAAPTVYGNVHLSIQQFDKDDGIEGAKTNGNIYMSSNTSSLGVKGSEDLGDGLKAIYKVEFQIDAADGVMGKDGNTITQRDTFTGIKGGFGTVKIGLMATNYKQTGPKVDSLWRTPAEGRGFINTQSKLQAGSGKVNSGRQASTLQYVSPKMAGIQLVANTSFTGDEDETSGIGVRWSNKAFLVFADWIDGQPQVAGANATESSMKFGGKFSAKSFFIGGQFEDTEDSTDYNFAHLNGGFLINKNNIITATYGTASHINDGNQDTTGMALAYDHKMSKMTDVYVAYVDRSSDTASKEDSAWSLGFRKKF